MDTLKDFMLDRYTLMLTHEEETVVSIVMESAPIKTSAMDLLMHRSSALSKLRNG